MRKRDPKDMVRDVLEPGEELLWYGAPNVEAGSQGRRRGLRVPSFIILAAMVGVAWYQLQDAGLPAFDTLRRLIETNPMFLYGVAGVFGFTVLARAFGFDAQGRLRRHFAKQAYGLTDRRVIVVEGKYVTTFAGDQLDQPRVVKRANGYDDVIFGRRRVHSGSDGRTRDPIQIERGTVGFKAIPNAEEMKSRLIEWIEGEIRESAEEIADFVEAQSEGGTTGFASRAGTATLRQSDSGMTIEYPEEWSVQVRKKKKPFGKTFLDREKWGSQIDVFDWNYVRIEGPSGCSVDVEVFETPPLVDFESMAHGKLAALAGTLIDADPMYEQNGMRGFTVARRSLIQANASTSSAGYASVVTPFRHTVLHDGRYQVTITSKWPEASPELAAAADLVVRSVRLE